MALELVVPRPVEVYLVAVPLPLVVLVRVLVLVLAVSDQATQGEASAAPVVQVVDCSVTRPVEALAPALAPAPARVDLAQAAGLAQVLDLALVVGQELPSNNPLLHARVLAAPHSAPSQKRTTAPM